MGAMNRCVACIDGTHGKRPRLFLWKGSFQDASWWFILMSHHDKSSWCIMCVHHYDHYSWWTIVNHDLAQDSFQSFHGNRLAMGPIDATQLFLAPMAFFPIFSTLELQQPGCHHEPQLSAHPHPKGVQCQHVLCANCGEPNGANSWIITTKHHDSSWRIIELNHHDHVSWWSNIMHHDDSSW